MQIKYRTNKTYFHAASIAEPDRVLCSPFAGRIDNAPLLHLPVGVPVRLSQGEIWLRHDGELAAFKAGDVVTCTGRGTPKSFSLIEVNRA